MRLKWLLPGSFLSPDNRQEEINTLPRRVSLKRKRCKMTSRMKEDSSRAEIVSILRLRLFPPLYLRHAAVISVWEAKAGLNILLKFHLVTKPAPDYYFIFIIQEAHCAQLSFCLIPFLFFFFPPSLSCLLKDSLIITWIELHTPGGFPDAALKPLNILKVSTIQQIALPIRRDCVCGLYIV